MKYDLKTGLNSPRMRHISVEEALRMNSPWAKPTMSVRQLTKRPTRPTAMPGTLLLSGQTGDDCWAGWLVDLPGAGNGW